jgi:uncharacterized Zn-finger protein
MTESESRTGKVEKICLENECAEAYAALPVEVAERFKDFVFCPYCSEELHLQCSVCGEGLSNKDFNFCPWCGAGFQE